MEWNGIAESNPLQMVAAGEFKGDARRIIRALYYGIPTETKVDTHLLRLFFPHFLAKFLIFLMSTRMMKTSCFFFFSIDARMTLGGLRVPLLFYSLSASS